MSSSVRFGRCAAILCALVLSVPSMAFGQSHAASASDVDIPLSDARNIGPNSVRFSAAQFTDKAPTIVIFGMTKESWPRLRAAIQQAVFEGYAVNSIFIGPGGAPPTLEIYAKGHHVTNPIDPNTIAGPKLTQLIKDVVREYYR